jgi:hypothetical protein
MPYRVDGASASVTGGSSLVPGAWTQVIATTLDDTDMVWLRAGSLLLSNADTRAMLDIAIGSSGHETSVVPSYPCGFSAAIDASSSLYSAGTIPVFIPKGSRVSVRLTAYQNSANCTFDLSLMKIPGRLRPSASRVVALGADPANARGTNMPSNNTYVTIAVANEPFRGLIMCPLGGAGSSYGSEASVYTLAIGPAGSEVPIVTATVNTTTGELLYVWQYNSTGANSGVAMPGVWLGNIPAGSTIRCKQSIGRIYRDVLVYGIPYA